MSGTLHPTLILREIALSDAAAVAELSSQLGYPVSPQIMAGRIEHTQRSPHHMAYVACVSETVVGWIHLSLGHHLQSEPHCEISGLVVADSARNLGIGQQLLARAEQWARAQGLTEMLVRSRTTREAAHRFYRRHGYAQIKTSAVFSKHLLSPTP